MTPEAEIEFMGKLAALELMVRSFVKGMAATKPDPSVFLLAESDRMVASVRAAGMPEGTPPQALDAIERLLRFTFEQAVLGSFLATTDALSTVSSTGRA